MQVIRTGFAKYTLSETSLPTWPSKSDYCKRRKVFMCFFFFFLVFFMEYGQIDNATTKGLILIMLV